MQKNVIFIPHQLLNRPQPYLLMHLITDIHYNDKFLGTVKLLPESVIGLKKTKTKSILVAVQDLQSFGIDLFLNISNLSIPLNFIYPKIRITNLDEHTLLCICGLFADRDVMHDFSMT